MTDNGKMTKPTEREYIATSTVQSIKAIGRKISSMVRGWRLGLMVRVMRVATRWAGSMAKVASRGLIKAPTQANSSTTILKASVSVVERQRAL